MRKRNSGFTLIELLAVIAIILILMGLITPAITSARRQARKVQCMSNLRQCLVALHAYAMDNDGEYPAAATWSVDIGDYIEDNADVISCTEGDDTYTMSAAAGGAQVESIDSDTRTLSCTTGAVHIGDVQCAINSGGDTETF